MRIGIDIDDTIADTWEFILPYYSEVFQMPMDELMTGTPYYGSLKNMVPLDKYFEMVNPIYDNIVPLVPLKENVKEIIDKLYEDGHKVIFISARGSGYTDSRKLTEDYLRKYDIKYDKLIEDCESKDMACVKEKIDLFIDNSIKHCESVSKTGIEVIMFETDFNKDYPKFKKINNWLDIYEYIKNR